MRRLRPIIPVMEHGALEGSRSSEGGHRRSVPKVMPQRDLSAASPDEPGRLLGAPLRLVTSALRNRKGWIATAAFATVVIHAAFGAFFLLLLDGRDLPNPPEKAIPVEVVSSIPEEHTPPPAPLPPPPTPSAAAAPKREAAPPPMVAAPPEAQHAASQTVRTTPASPLPDPDVKTDSPVAAIAPPAAASVMTAAGGAFTVLPAVPEPAEAPPEVQPRPTAPSAATAALARALPMDLSAFPSTFQAVLSGSGAQASLDYKGLVYGRIQRSHRAMDEARARHLRGEVIVSFGIDQQGHATDLKIAESSGDPALDELGLAMIREAEPFPPPPGAGQMFTPALAVGEE